MREPNIDAALATFERGHLGAVRRAAAKQAEVRTQARRSHAPQFVAPLRQYGITQPSYVSRQRTA